MELDVVRIGVLTTNTTAMQPARRTILLPLLASLLASFGCVAPVFAGIIFSVDMDLGTAGIQPTRVVAPGDIFTVGLVLTVDASGVPSYGISMNFNPAELSLNGVTPAANNPTLPGGLASIAPPTWNMRWARCTPSTGRRSGLGQPAPASPSGPSVSR